MSLKTELQQDNNLAQSRKSTRERFRKKSVGVMEWPSQSPDLNPIVMVRKDLFMQDILQTSQTW